MLVTAFVVNAAQYTGELKFKILYETKYTNAIIETYM
jgi:hypothetical protein